MAHGSNMILVQPQSESVVIRLGNRHAMAPRSLSRSKISTPRSTNLKDAVSASILKRLKRLFAGWRNFAIQTETSWSFTNARNDETRNHGERAFGHFYHSSFELVSSFVIRHSSLRSCLFSSIRP